MQKTIGWLVITLVFSCPVLAVGQDELLQQKEVIKVSTEDAPPDSLDALGQVGDLGDGPIFQTIGKRLDVLDEHLAERDTIVLSHLSEMQAFNAGIMAKLAEAAQERRELREDRDGLLSRLSSLSEELKQAREERKQMRSEMQGWTPLQNLVERINGLIIRLMFTIALVTGGIILFITAMGWFLNRNINKIKIPVDLLTKDTLTKL